ncbi:MAG: hypothetical protein Q8S11_08565 [Daejeonella sp.]|uniref:hypothetical protein n=1 Tax=Daejeonella sp. TaxID=2805397 RepID=UPI00273577FC|nr:hypothetical protein [Daejeonella sp.]MDP3468374.1 hypothetical protein [Daejeonella sp.]
MNISIFNNLYISIFTTFILCFNTVLVLGQIFDAEQNPPGIKWMQIRTDNFQILYSEELENEAQRMSNTLEHLISGVSKSLNKRPRPITIILQNQGVISNGFVQLAPRRSEFYTTPPQNLDFQDWLDGVAIHELRHVVQFDKLSGGLKAPFFEELALAIFGISLPPWFYEGDAVGIETALSHAGRGRLPDWELIFRTNTLSTHPYSYSKNYFGSLRDLTPGYYQLGYFMTTKLKRDYGKDIIDSIMTRIKRNPLRPYSLSNSIKKFTGLNSKMLHDSSIAELKSLWEKQSLGLFPLKYAAINKRKDSIPADYLLPVSTSTDEIIALRQNLTHTPALILIDSEGRERTLRRIGFQTEYNFRYAAGKIVWDEFRIDKRYRKRSYNVINIFDLEHGQVKQLTHKSRLFSPSLSADAKTIVAVRISTSNRFSLIELDAENGSLLREYPVKEGFSLQHPSYNEQGDKIISVVMSKDGAALMEFGRLDGNYKIITSFQRQQIARPVYANNNILFRAHYKGLNNIYCLTPEHEIIPLTSAPYGATNPSYDKSKNRVLFNNYQLKGYDIVSIPLDLQTKNRETIDSFIDYASPLVIQESNANILDSIPQKKYPAKSYNEFNNLLNFHSLSPIAKNSEIGDELSIGLKFKSNNQLNTLDLYGGYQYNSGLRKSEYLAGLSYKRFYPILDITYSNRANLIYSRQNNRLVPVSWRENITEAELSIPFAFNRLNKSYSMGIRSSSSFTSRYEVQNKPSNFIEKLKFPMKYQLYLSRNTQRSARDLAPAWGQNFSLSYFHLPFQHVQKGSLLSFRSIFYTPGLLSNHSFQASFNYQENSGAYDFSIEIPRISGYRNLSLTTQLRNTLLLDYRFPLFYPDAELGPIAYIKRLKGGFFADFENIGKGAPLQPRTFGLELSTDMNLMRFMLPNFELAGKLIFAREKALKKPILEIGFLYDF